MFDDLIDIVCDLSPRSELNFTQVVVPQALRALAFFPDFLNPLVSILYVKLTFFWIFDVGYYFLGVFVEVCFKFALMAGKISGLS